MAEVTRQIVDPFGTNYIGIAYTYTTVPFPAYRWVRIEALPSIKIKSYYDGMLDLSPCSTYPSTKPAWQGILHNIACPPAGGAGIAWRYFSHYREYVYSINGDTLKLAYILRFGGPPFTHQLYVRNQNNEYVFYEKTGGVSQFDVLGVYGGMLSSCAATRLTAPATVELELA